MRGNGEFKAAQTGSRPYNTLLVIQGIAQILAGLRNMARITPATALSTPAVHILLYGVRRCSECHAFRFHDKLDRDGLCLICQRGLEALMDLISKGRNEFLTFALLDLLTDEIDRWKKHATAVTVLENRPQQHPGPSDVVAITIFDVKICHRCGSLHLATEGKVCEDCDAEVSR